MTNNKLTPMQKQKRKADEAKKNMGKASQPTTNNGLKIMASEGSREIEAA
eukprot:CAMPEP_0201927968 /NCGR_PEP_ID=MMETSP0903-20130614/19894_1 /ASSEMBLY_ACC=CAM_ASM_000552 /TAXON_ID=420261 /ORGANISM="Thalassiosira antarctica, Strain CCMP982" /LENGTH=49 /DNA_ID= /DNA_START= /DNA_END= /DNA_ORIENTATION=